MRPSLQRRHREADDTPAPVAEAPPASTPAAAPAGHTFAAIDIHAPAPEAPQAMLSEQPQVASETEAAIGGMRGGGQPLDPAARAMLEPRFGHDFSQVRVHTDSQAAATSQALSARAFTIGSDIAFGAGQYQPGSDAGQRLLAHELTHVVQQGQAGPIPGAQAEAHAGAGSAAGSPGAITQRAPISVQGGWLTDTWNAFGAMLNSLVGGGGGTSAPTQTTAPTTTNAPATTAPATGTTATQTYPQVVTIGTERVEVASEDEKTEAERIISQIKTDYGIEVSSLASVDAIKAQYDKVPDTVKNSLVTKEWKFKELQALGKALAHFAPILGGSRSLSNRATEDQEVTSVGKVKQAINTNKATGQLDTTTLGEYFKGSKNFSMFEAGEDSTVDFPGENNKQLEATAIHEIAHGLLKYALSDYVKEMDYWQDERTASGKAGAEAPITDYGAKNASEDLSEAVMFFFTEPETLKNGRGAAAGTPGNPCPKRYLFLSNLVASWGPRDLPTLDPNDDTRIA